MRLAVVGPTGFVGSAIVRAAGDLGVDVVPISGLRCPPVEPSNVARAAKRWIADDPDRFRALVAQLHRVDTVVNAAGLATPDSSADAALLGANAVLPGVVAQAAAEAGVSRLVQVSSAAVQGRRDPLDESPTTAPLTAYARSKAQGEAVLLDGSVATPASVSVYRPTSVQGLGRGMTHQLVRIAALPFVPLAGTGEVPLPVTLIENVAAGILTICRAEAVATVVLQPWEGLTTRSFLELLGAARTLKVPVPVWRGLLGAVQATTANARVVAILRRVELLAYGQRQEANALAALGFSPPAGTDGYRVLARQVRAGNVTVAGQ